MNQISAVSNKLVQLFRSCPSGPDAESREHEGWIPAFAGMTKSDTFFLETALGTVSERKLEVHWESILKC